jgi:uncharacterized protein YndB with AHSA1/START domain
MNSLAQQVRATKEMTTMNDFNTSFVVDQTPAEVFAAINNVREWWGEDVEGSNEKVGDEFIYRVQDIHYSKLRVLELVPDKKIVWTIAANHMNFVEDQTEWVGTKITFEISRKDNRTEVAFSHLGLLPQFECFDVCSNAWGSLMHGSLPNLITTGKGNPYK